MDFLVMLTASFKLLLLLVCDCAQTPRDTACQRDRSPDGLLGHAATAETFPGDTPIRFMIRDNDSIFSDRVDEVIARFGIEPKTTSFRSPWQNGLAERWAGTVKRDLLDHVIVTDERHLQQLLHEYVDYYNNERVHTVLRDSPTGRPRRVRLNPTPESLGDRDWEDFTIDTRGETRRSRDLSTSNARSA